MSRENWSSSSWYGEGKKYISPKDEMALKYGLKEKASWLEIWEEADKVSFVLSDYERRRIAKGLDLPENAEWDEIEIVRKKYPQKEIPSAEDDGEGEEKDEAETEEEAGANVDYGPEESPSVLSKLIAYTGVLGSTYFNPGKKNQTYVTAGGEISSSPSSYSYSGYVTPVNLDKEKNKAFEEKTKSKLIKQLGLKKGATWQEVAETYRDNEVAALCERLKLPPDASIEEILETERQNSIEEYELKKNATWRDIKEARKKWLLKKYELTELPHEELESSEQGIEEVDKILTNEAKRYGLPLPEKFDGWKNVVDIYAKKHDYDLEESELLENTSFNNVVRSSIQKIFDKSEEFNFEVNEELIEAFSKIDQSIESILEAIQAEDNPLFLERLSTLIKDLTELVSNKALWQTLPKYLKPSEKEKEYYENKLKKEEDGAKEKLEKAKSKKERKKIEEEIDRDIKMWKERILGEPVEDIRKDLELYIGTCKKHLGFGNLAIPKKDNLQFDREEVEELMASPSYSPAVLLEIVEKSFKEFYAAGTGVNEGYTLKEHTIMFLRQFEKYFGHKTISPDVTNDFIKFVICLHDAGKPEALQKGGKHLQHPYTKRIMKKTLENLGYSKAEVNFAVALVDGDPIGEYLQGGSLFGAITKIRKMAKAADLPIDRFYQILLCYYTSDTASYTEDAQGKYSLDYLFEFDHQNRQIKFVEKTNKKIEALTALVLEML